MVGNRAARLQELIIHMWLTISMIACQDLVRTTIVAPMGGISHCHSKSLSFPVTCSSVHSLRSRSITIGLIICFYEIEVSV